MNGAGKVAAVLIAGPTTSGKSDLAVGLAERVGGTVVNADSMQVYRDLRILTARPTPADEARVPHRLFGHVDGATNYSAGHYTADLAEVLGELGREGRLPIIVGGTGLYFRAALEGLSAIPAVPDEVRDALRREADGVSAADLHARLATLDPEGAGRLRPSDRQRVQRALEVAVATGRPLASFHDSREPGPLSGRPVLAFRLEVDRAVLRERIDRRFDRMMAERAPDEVRRLAARSLDPALPVMRAHGVPGLLAHLRGALPLAEAIARAKADTRAYAKRQETWARHQMTGWLACAPEIAEAVVLEALAAAGALPTTGRQASPSGTTSTST